MVRALARFMSSEAILFIVFICYNKNGEAIMKKVNNVEYSIKYHIVWTTRGKNTILKSKIAERTRQLVRQSCKSLNVDIVSGQVGINYVHLLVSCPPNLSVSKLVQHLKGRCSKILLSEFLELRESFLEQHLWDSGYFCKSVGYALETEVRRYIGNDKSVDIQVS